MKKKVDPTEPEELEDELVLDEEEIEKGTCGPDGKPLKRCVQPGKLPPFLRGAIKEWWMVRGPYKDIQLILEAGGYFVPKANLTVWADQQWPDALPTLEPFDPELLAKSPQEQAIQLLWAKTVTAVRSITAYRSYAIKNIAFLSASVSKLATAQATLDKIESDKLKAGGDTQKIIEAAKEQLMAEVRRILEHRPDLLPEVDKLETAFIAAAENLKLLQ